MQTVLIALVIAIGLTAGSLAWRVASAPRMAPDFEATDPAIGYAFYQALDDVLATGDRSALDRVVSGGFIDHIGDQETSTGKLVDQLKTFHASFPDTQFQVREIQSAEGTLVASIEPVRLTGPLLGGMQISTNPMAGGYEVLRVRHGKITDRWAGGLPDVQLASFTDAGLQVGSSFSNMVRLEQIELPEDTSFTWRAFGQRVLLVTQGTVQLDSRWIGSQGEAMHDSQTINAGQAVLSPSGTTVTVREVGQTPARTLILLLTVQQVTPTDSTLIERGPGTKLDLLWQSNLSTLPMGSWSLSFARLSLPPETTAELTSDSSTTVLLSSENDSARISTDTGSISTLDANYVPADAGMGTSLAAGTAALVEETDSVEIASAGSDPATVWLIRIQLDAPSATPEAR
jgi:hypothetical protein